uniref:KH domain-containing, RNA-binding, signal transduction-associated protein 1b n=1 Tax=Oncorhynchus gorbuscha TaxID=8017 RepID=UPI001EAEFF78|nr:KH domain-containing, RNA-binding, signal transduction-associated protein 1b [Oncorhynchus gorbuscha]
MNSPWSSDKGHVVIGYIDPDRGGLCSSTSSGTVLCFQEEGLRKGGEAKYAHLSMELHVFIEVFAPVPEAYLRMAHAMEEVKKFLFPDMMDDICQEQFMEMGYLNGGQEHGPGAPRGRGGPPGPRSRGGPPGQPGAPRGRGIPQRGGTTRGGPARGGVARGAPAGRGTPARGATTPRARLAAPGGPPRTLPPPHQHATAPEQYEEYAYDESYTEPAYESYDSYYSQPQAEPEYYDYGHGETQEAYEPYAQDGWNGTQRAAPGGKAPTARAAKGPYREHPYRQY